jgi:phage terminase large subunit GpA-like protein
MMRPDGEKIRDLWTRSCRFFRPPPRMDLIQWADTYRRVAAKTSANPGKWRTATQPAAFGPMAALSDPGTATVSIMAGTQILKSEVLLCACGYFIDLDPSAILLVQPTESAAESFSKERFWPMVQATPRLAAVISPAREKSSENTITHKDFPGGSLDFCGANSPTSLSSRPKRIILCDEIDKYPHSAGVEGDPLKLAEERASTYASVGRAKFLRTCSPTDKETSRIAREYSFSDRRKLFLACPYCGHSQTLTWARVDWDKGETGEHLPETAGIKCEACDVRWTERDRRTALSALEHAPGYGWRQTKEFACCGVLQRPRQWTDAGRSVCERCGQLSNFAGHAGFHISKLYSARHRLSDVVREFVESKGVPELLRKWTNTALAETWELMPGEGIDGSGLQSRAELYGPDDLPLGVLTVTGFADVQDNRLEAQFIGWGLDEEAWPFLYEVIHLDPAQPNAWRELKQLITRTFRRCDGRVMRCAAFGIDSGGHHGASVYSFAKSHRGHRLFPTVGVGGRGRPIWQNQARRSKNNDLFWRIGVDTAKDALYGRLRIEPNADGSPTPGCIHFPVDESFNEEYFKQLTSERREKFFKFGHPGVRWVLPSGKHNEALDTFIGALAVRGSLPGWQKAALGFSARPTAPAPVKPDVPPELYQPPEQPEQPARNKTCPQIDTITGRDGGWLSGGRGWWGNR